MMSDLDKDIEILKEVQAIFEHLKNHGWVKDITKEVDIDKVIQAIEKVLWALNGKDCVIETQSHNEEVLEEYIAKLEKELETYKKIAEKPTIEFAKELNKASLVMLDGRFIGGERERVLRFYKPEDIGVDIKVNEVGKDVQLNEKIFHSGKHFLELKFYHNESIDALIHRLEHLKTL